MSCADEAPIYQTLVPFHILPRKRGAPVVNGVLATVSMRYWGGEINVHKPQPINTHLDWEVSVRAAAAVPN